MGCSSGQGDSATGGDTEEVSDDVVASDEPGATATDSGAEDTGAAETDTGEADVSDDYDFGDEYTPHGRILIDGNDEFHAMAAQEGWTGDGSKEHPYLITGYEIDLAKTAGGAVEVHNTDVHFIVRGCYLHGGIHTLGKSYGYGVLAWNVQNMLVERTVATDNFEGVRLEKGTSDCVIRYNDLSKNAGHGVALASAHNNIIEYNLCTHEKDDGMLFGSFNQASNFDAANNNIVRYNEFSDNSTSGVCLFRGSGNRFYGNAFGKGNGVAILNTAGKNEWDNGEVEGGNWWVNFEGEDQDGDGILDKEKTLPGGAVDRYPLAKRPSTTP
jgi:parallel beta-helix repeat protein